MIDELTPRSPFRTSEYPTVAPTMEWVPEIGSFMAVANRSQMAEAIKLDRAPNIRSFSSPSYISLSRIPFLIVSETCGPAIII